MLPAALRRQEEEHGVTEGEPDLLQPSCWDEEEAGPPQRETRLSLTVPQTPSVNLSFGGKANKQHAVKK